ncbi:MAG: hypothetical protein OZ913_00545 [Ignavibacteriaceae bacterium]|jgi:hypothetical protein|nr:MAG: hypothetical protein EDM69_04660 [Chlorobiota bacterium]MBV6397698.1 hypothetical protein [Ignavibacteria bacterium]MCC6885478.1 hypothetical protein [Ignavibacteriales bacterium]MCE7952830.1 hypothetical protein [Chlorobi bacterium CHB7]MDL1887003.1 hypothetical protein [Ignavibacteria bacterium CHB1]MEB2328775.1 hypothetical protein [Ignavibacteriaceae bacterium]OQY79065.1 MAG: hypothetical protein B6D43_00265 [Ignavibacteriales bacterium UTCHB1]RIK49591.1 MAG: hypothetical protein
MKKLKLVVFALLFSLTFLSCSKQENPTDKPGAEDKTEESKTEISGEVKSFQVQYKITGGIMEGESTQIVQGSDFKSTVSFKVAGQSFETVTFSSGDSVYMMMDMGYAKQNVVMGLKEFKGESSDDPTKMDIAGLQEELKKHKKLGTETIIGKLCQIYDIGGGTLMSVYDDQIPLKIQNKEMTLVATAFEINPELPKDTFTPPADVVFKSVKSMIDIND